MDDTGDTMVNTDDTGTGAEPSHERSDYVVPAHLEFSKDDDRSNCLESNCSSGPEYATITRIRQHDPPTYFNLTNDSTSSRRGNEDDEAERDDRSPSDDAERRSRDEEENRIDVLDTLLVEDDRKKQGSNGIAPGAGWIVGAMGAAALAAASGSDKGNGPGDVTDSAIIADRNSKILEQFEDKGQRDKDECIVDCIYYTTTCCECNIL